MSFPYLSVINLQCARNNTLLFYPISFSLYPGAVMHLCGENGVGKTTLLRCLAGLSKPYQGIIEILGQKITTLEKYKQHLFYLGHKIAIKNSLTALENIIYTSSSYRLTDAQASYALSKVKLEHKKNMLAGSLSAGQRQRLALAKLVLSTAKIWILDEPFSALDSQGIDLAQSFLEEHINNQGVVIVTSHQALSMHYGNQINLELRPCLERLEQEVF